MAEEASRVIGIDAAVWQGELPVASLEGASIRFAIVKATHGLNKKPDAQFRRSWEALGQSTLLRGAYHWFTDADPKAQAEHFVETVGDVGSLDVLPLGVDFEEPSTVYSGKVLLDRLRVCLEHVEALSERRVMLYSGTWYWQKFVGDAEAFDLVSRYFYWHSQYPRTVMEGRRACGQSPPELPKPTLPAPWEKTKTPYFLWQFDGNGGCELPNGIDADFNVFAGTFEELATVCNARRSEAVNTLLAHVPYELLIAEDFVKSLAL